MYRAAMKRMITSLVLIGFCIAGLQSQITLTDCPDRPVGRTAEGREILGKCFTSGERIQELALDSSGQHLLIKTRGVDRKGKKTIRKGKMIIADSDTRQVRWYEPFDYGEDREILLPQGILLVHQEKKSALLSWQTGDVLWKARESPFVVDQKNKILLCYNNTALGGITDKLGGIDIATGNVIWETSVSHTFGWNWEGMLNDSVRVVISDGLHLINMRDGSGYSYPARTGFEDYRDAAVTGALGVLAGILTGTFFVPAGGTPVTGLVSEVLYEDSVFYIADRDKLVCLDAVLAPLWEYEFGKKEAAESTLFLRENWLYMLNLGRGYVHGHLADGPVHKTISIGQPFIACFDKATGDKIYLSRFGSENNLIQDIFIGQEAVYIIFNKGGIGCHRLSDPRGVDMILWNKEKYGVPQGFVARVLYIYNSDTGKYEEIIPAAGQTWLFNENNDIIQVDEELRVLRFFPSDEKFIVKHSWNDLLLIENKKADYLIDRSGTLLGKLDRPPVYCAANKIFSVDEERMQVIAFDLNLFLPTLEKNNSKGKVSH